MFFTFNGEEFMDASRRAQIARLLMAAYFQEKGFHIHGGLMDELTKTIDAPADRISHLVRWLIMKITPTLGWGNNGALDISPPDDVTWSAFKALVVHELKIATRSPEEVARGLAEVVRNTIPDLAGRAGVPVDAAATALICAVDEATIELRDS